MHSFNGSVIQANGRYFYVDGGRCRYIGTPDVFNSHGFDSTSIIEVDEKTVKEMRWGANLPHRWPWDTFLEGRATEHRQMRELIVSQVNGSGVEFGPGQNPFLPPRGVDIRYMDRVGYANQRPMRWPGVGSDAFVPLDGEDSFDQMSSIGAGELDFIIASHVIEHLVDPLGAVLSAYDRLKRGGMLCLVIPDKRWTPVDHHRQITPISHIVEDHENPSKVRDFEHFLDFYKQEARLRGDWSQEYVKLAEEAFHSGLDTHYHVWDYAAFYEMMNYARKNGAPWNDLWGWPKLLLDDDCLEFYFVMRK